MSRSRNIPIDNLEAAEQLPSYSYPHLLHILRHLFSVSLGKSNFPSIKLCGYFLTLMIFCFFCLLPVSGVGATDYWAPWVTKLSTNSATINWRGTSTASGSIDYATSSYYDEHHSFDKTISSTTTAQYQHVQITNLEPNTSYVYRVKPSDNPDAFGNRKFRTMPASGSFTFIVISDTHAQEKRFKYVADAIAAHETDVLFILDGGDYAGWDDETFWTVYFQYADGMLAKFPIFTTIGNHEYHNNGHAEGPPTAADQYHWSYDVPPGGALNHSFDCSGVRFVVLDSPDPNNADGDDPQTSLALAQSQESWLREQLDNTMAGTFTIHHHPIWDYGRTGINANLKPWETLYHTYKISANFAGHTHNYQRYAVNGIPYFVVGNGGGKFTDINNGSPSAIWYLVGDTRKLGYLKVTVDPANNTATAQEIYVAWVATDTSETATVYDPPIIGDTITFSLKPIGAPLSWGSSKIAALFSDYGADSGIWSYDGNSWQRLTDWKPAQMIGYGTAGIMASFNGYGSGNGLWRYDGSSWSSLTDWVPADMVSYPGGNIAGNFTDYGSSGNGIWRYNGGWSKLTDWTPDGMATLGGDVLVGSFSNYGTGNGVYQYDGSAWSRISDWTPDSIKSWGTRLAAIFTNYGNSGNGIWIYNSSWQQATDWTPRKILSWKSDTMLAGIFGNYGSGSGLYSYDGTSWTRLTDWVPTDMAKLGTDDLVAVFKDYGDSGNGIWWYSSASTSWTRITDWTPDTVSSSGDYITAVFTNYGSSGNGVWKYQGGSWTRLTDWVPKKPAP